MIITIPEQTPLLNKWQRYHWTQRRRITERFAWLIMQDIKVKPKSPIASCEIIIERHCSGILPDWDGLYGGLKPALDCLVVNSRVNPHGLGLIVDDSPLIIKNLTATPVKSSRLGHKTVIYINTLEG